MRARDEQSIELILEGERILHTEKVQFVVEVSDAPRKARLFSTATRLLLYARTPMGMQITLVRYTEIERITTGKKKGNPYVQFLGDSSRVLVLFGSKSKRNAFHELCTSLVTVN